MLWNGLVSFFNIGNFILFMILSTYDVNTILRENAFVDSQTLAGYYQTA
jgi:hypothetical protein